MELGASTKKLLSKIILSIWHSCWHKGRGAQKIFFERIHRAKTIPQVNNPQTNFQKIQTKCLVKPKEVLAVAGKTN